MECLFEAASFRFFLEQDGRPVSLTVAHTLKRVCRLRFSFFGLVLRSRAVPQSFGLLVREGAARAATADWPCETSSRWRKPARFGCKGL
jgi:hypothetical protein